MSREAFLFDPSAAPAPQRGMPCGTGVLSLRLTKIVTFVKNLYVIKGGKTKIVVLPEWLPHIEIVYRDTNWN